MVFCYHHGLYDDKITTRPTTDSESPSEFAGAMLRRRQPSRAPELLLLCPRRQRGQILRILLSFDTCISALLFVENILPGTAKAERNDSSEFAACMWSVKQVTGPRKAPSHIPPTATKSHAPSALCPISSFYRHGDAANRRTRINNYTALRVDPRA
ncbi:hypothetical protein LY76DRAFT_147536 [Colletotrichum caudatum]|nr:hypothetical protein LY76DRAFT_147536 [Colletotrichum caudatum]